MNSQIQKVLYYIETHLDDELDVEILSKIAGYSPFHFCRIFKAYVGESVISYTTRLRVKKASLMVLDNQRSIIEVALDVGYQTPNGFNKAFKKIFGMTPTAYRSRRIEMLRTFKEKMMQIPTIVERDTAYVVYRREMGAYEQSSEVAWKMLSEDLNGLGAKLVEEDIKTEIVLDPKNAELLGICYDDPTTTKEDNIRYEAAIAWKKDEIVFLKKRGFDTKEIPGGRYAVVLYQGGYKKAIESWLGMYAWIEENGYKIRDIPAFEKYLNTPLEVSEADVLTEIYIPID